MISHNAIQQTLMIATRTTTTITTCNGEVNSAENLDILDVRIIL